MLTSRAEASATGRGAPNLSSYWQRGPYRTTNRERFFERSTSLELLFTHYRAKSALSCARSLARAAVGHNGTKVLATSRRQIQQRAHEMSSDRRSERSRATAAARPTSCLKDFSFRFLSKPLPWMDADNAKNDMSTRFD